MDRKSKKTKLQSLEVNLAKIETEKIHLRSAQNILTEKNQILANELEEMHTNYNYLSERLKETAAIVDAVNGLTNTTLPAHFSAQSEQIRSLPRMLNEHFKRVEDILSDKQYIKILERLRSMLGK